MCMWDGGNWVPFAAAEAAAASEMQPFVVVVVSVLSTPWEKC